MFKAGIDDDKFVLVANSNETCQVAVKTPWGSLTERKTLHNIEMQGGVLTPLKCSVQIDTLGKEMMEDTEMASTMLKYKDCVSIPVLTFIDDALSSTECGPSSVKMNAYIQSKMNTKKHKLGDSKCVKMHIGSQTSTCPSLKVNNKEMQSSCKEKYLGDIITNNAKIDESIKMRHDKGIGICNKILSILKEASFGIYHFEVGLMFRTSLLINGILFNTEALFSMNESHVNMLEDCDKYLMRSLFNTEISTPIESLFIETSTVPLRFILYGRRIMFYWTLMHKGEEELAKRVFVAMNEFGTKGDWITKTKEDMINCDINLTDEEIFAMSEWKFRKLVNKKIKERSVQYLTELQIKHTKSMFLHQGPTIAEYLTTEQLNTKQKQLLFKLRSGVTPNKSNYRTKYKDDLSCILCRDQNTVEDLHHLLQCSFLLGQPELVRQISSIKPDDIYGTLANQITAVRTWENIFKIYTDYKES